MPTAGTYQRWVQLAWYASAAQLAVEAIPDGLIDPEAVMARERIVAWRDRLVAARDAAREEWRHD